MGLIDIYLQQHGKAREDVLKQTELHKQSQLNADHLNVEEYNSKIIGAIASTVNKEVENVRQELQSLEAENASFEVLNESELLRAFQNKEPSILIKGTYAKEVKKAAETSLSEKDKLGFELGSAGVATVFAEGIYRIMNAFSKEDKQKQKIEAQIRKYHAVPKENNEILLYLRQLDY